MNFFEITRFNTKELILEPTKINLSCMLTQITYEFNPVLKEKNLQWEMNISDNIEIVCDVDKLERAIDNLIRNAVNYLFQSYALISDMTVFLNLLLSMHFLHLCQKEKEERIHQILKTVGLSHLENAMVNTLSGGEQQRVALARTILKPGNLILADEPTGALDAKSAELSFSLICNLCKKYHKTVIMVTHSLDLAQRADRVIDLSSY